MNINELREYWKSEEEKAHIIGWDFSYIEGRYESEEDSLPWDYAQVVKKYLRKTDRILDIDTGGGEFLLSLGHPHELTSATEGYPPNVKLCLERFAKLGIDFHEMNDHKNMPFDDESFDMIIDRHGSYDESELYRVLKPGGVFITQQVGEDNDRELVEMLLPDVPKQYVGHDLTHCLQKLENAGFIILESGEAHPPIRFFETAALVWFAKIIEWEFVGFSVDKCFEQLMAVENEIKHKGYVCANVHRFYIAARKL